MKKLLALLCLLSSPAFAGGTTQGSFVKADTTNSNIAVGPGSLGAITTGTQNTVVGINSGTGITIGIGNTIFGNGEGILVTGTYNTILGYSDTAASDTSNAVVVGYGAKGGVNDIAVGSTTLSHAVSGSANNVAVGNGALTNSTSGFSNIAIGSAAGALYAGRNAQANTLVGLSAGSVATTGTNNLVLGALVASTTMSGGSNNILIGTNSAIDVTTTNASNEIHIGGSGGDWVKVTGTNTQSTQITQFYGTGIAIGATSTPANNATCTAGTLWWDTGFLYLCTASGTVKRATLATY